MLRRHLSLVVLAAALVVATAAPAALARVEPGPPNMATAVPSAPGALTGTHARTPADEAAAALAQERYLSSYGAPAPLPRPERPGTAGGSGVPWAGIAVAGGIVLLLAAVVVGQRAVPARRSPMRLG